MGEARSTYGEKRCVYKVMMGKPEDGRSFGRPGVDGKIIIGWLFRV